MSKRTSRRISRDQRLPIRRSPSSPRTNPATRKTPQISDAVLSRMCMEATRSPSPSPDSRQPNTPPDRLPVMPRNPTNRKPERQDGLFSEQTMPRRALVGTKITGWFRSFPPFARNGRAKDGWETTNLRSGKFHSRAPVTSGASPSSSVSCCATSTRPWGSCFAGLTPSPLSLSACRITLFRPVLSLPSALS